MALRLNGTLLCGTAAAAGLAVMLATSAWGTGGIQNTFNSTYFGSLTNANAGCATCHVDPGGGANWNAYGWQIKLFKDQGFGTSDSILMSEPFDSDNDPTGSTNLEEILGSTQPGWTPGPHNTHYFDGSSTPDQMPTAGILGDLDPAAACSADLTGDNFVNVDDLLMLLGAWGQPGGDITGDGTTDVNDLLEVLGQWGACP